MRDRPTITRRSLLAGAFATGMCAAAPPALAVPRPPHVDRRLWLLNVDTGEEVRAAYWRRGRWDAGALEALDHLMRDWHVDTLAQIDRRLYDVLSEIDLRIDIRGPIRILSGYRTETTNRSLPGSVANSFHTQARAADLWIYGVSTERLAHTARGLQAGGVGSYPSGRFIHVDTGPVRSW